MSFHPQTPQSPSQLSPGTSDLASSMNTSLTSITTALPTPAHSVNGSISQPPDMANDPAAGDDASQKRKRSVDDVGDRDRKKVHIENDRLGIEDLHLDVGEKYLLCKTPHRTQRFPPVTEDLFEMFGLTELAAEVAREKPNGEKNALRKTYKGHIKRLGVMGRFDSVAQDWEERRPEAKPEPETDMEMDEDEYEEPRQKEATTEPYFGFGKISTMNDRDFWQGRAPLSQGLFREVKAKLSRAVSMAKGPVPQSSWDASVLGDLGSADTSKNTIVGKTTTPGTPIGASGITATKQKPQAQGAPRPQRNNKKRGYGDSSFEGYGEGFPDDGYSTGDGDDRAGQKRRKKSAGTPQFQNGTPRPTYSAGVGT